MNQETRNWAMLLHLSVFAGYIVPMAGLIAPILIWQLKKEQMPELDAHGKEVANFMISTFIYGLACFVLTFLLIGIPLFVVLAIASIVLPILGAIKANNGEFYRYPFLIRIL